MIEFKKNILIIGCGSIAQCVIPILFQLINISPKQVTVIDFTDKREKISNALNNGVNYEQLRLTPENYKHELKKRLSTGDICVDLAWNIDTVDLINWCHTHGVCYLNTSVELWDPFEKHQERDPRELTLYHRQMALRKMASQWTDSKGPTAIVDHGANPGLVSHFTKQALIDIGSAILKKSTHHRQNTVLEKALADQNFPLLASICGIKTIHISERDSQIINDPKKMNEFVNTWSTMGFIEEGLAPSEIGWGTHEMTVPEGAMSHENGPKNQICLPQKGIKTWARSWVPSGEILGMIIRHGEAFGISDALTLWKDGTPIYRPTVNYVYCPCDAALSSLHELEMRHFIPQENQRVVNSEIISGKDELGCLLMGHQFNSWWIGSVLDIQEARRLVPGQNATGLQVAISVVAAIILMIRHPNLGFCLPDQLNFSEILEITKPYLGQVISAPVNWTPLQHMKAFLNFNQSLPQIDDVWQFSNFLIPIRKAESYANV